MDTCSNVYLSDLACSVLEEMGHNVLHLGNITLPGSSDLGDVSYHCPAIQLGMSMGEREDKVPYEAHTREFAEQACTPQALDNCIEFVKAFAVTAYKLMTESEHLKKIKEEFDREVAGQI